MIAPGDTWGPWAADLDEAERRARLRCLRAVVHLSTGPRGAELVRQLQRAERDPTALPLAVAALSLPDDANGLAVADFTGPAVLRALEHAEIEFTLQPEAC